MKITIKQEPHIIMSNPNAVQQYFAWPTVARLQDGTLMTVASGFRRGHICPLGKAVGIKSRDEGKTWSNIEVIIDTNLDDRDAGILPFGEKGVMVTSFNNTPEYQRTRSGNTPWVCEYTKLMEALCENEGKAWDKHLGSTMAISRDMGFSFSEPMVVPVTCPHGPCQLNDGTILYVGNRVMGSTLSESAEVLDSYEVSDDGKCTYRGSIEGIPGRHMYEPHTIQLKNGRIVVLIRVQKSANEGELFTLYMSTSDDNGYTFTKPRQVVGDTSGAPGHMIEHSSGALIAVYGHRLAPCGIRAAFSHDGGETWDFDHILVENEPSDDLGYPSSVELSGGDVLTVFYTKKDEDSFPCVIKQVVWNFEK